MGNCYSQKQQERQFQEENIQPAPLPPQPKPRVEESSSYETDSESESSLPPPAIQPSIPAVSRQQSAEQNIDPQKPPPKPKRGIVGKMDDTVTVEDGLKMTEYKHSQSITSSMSDFDDSLDYLERVPEEDDLPLATVYHVGATQTSPSWTDEFLLARQAEMLRQQPPIKYPAPSLAPKSSSYLRMPPIKEPLEKTSNEDTTAGSSVKWQHYKELQSRVDSAISSLGSPEGTFSIKDRSRNQRLPLETTAHKDLEDTRKKLYSVLDDAFFLTSPNGVAFASKTLSTSLPPVDSSYSTDFKSNLLSQSLRQDPPDNVDDLIAHSSSLRRTLK